MYDSFLWSEKMKLISELYFPLWNLLLLNLFKPKSDNHVFVTVSLRKPKNSNQVLFHFFFGRRLSRFLFCILSNSKTSSSREVLYQTITTTSNFFCGVRLVQPLIPYSFRILRFLVTSRYLSHYKSTVSGTQRTDLCREILATWSVQQGTTVMGNSRRSRGTRLKYQWTFRKLY